jgi:cytochrome c5
MKLPIIVAATLSAFSFSQLQAATGESVYKSVCMACHTTGALNAPKIGDNKAWAKLIAEGQTILTAHGYVGVRGMPAKGGKPDLSVEDFSSALVYMVNQSGGNWKQIGPNELKAIKTEIDLRVKDLASRKIK